MTKGYQDWGITARIQVAQMITSEGAWDTTIVAGMDVVDRYQQYYYGRGLTKTLMKYLRMDSLRDITDIKIEVAHQKLSGFPLINSYYDHFNSQTGQFDFRRHNGITRSYVLTPSREGDYHSRAKLAWAHKLGRLK